MLSPGAELQYTQDMHIRELSTLVLRRDLTARKKAAGKHGSVNSSRTPHIGSICLGRDNCRPAWAHYMFLVLSGHFEPSRDHAWLLAPRKDMSTNILCLYLGLLALAMNPAIRHQTSAKPPSQNDGRLKRLL